MGEPLPVDAALPGLCEALARGHAVLTAPPGSGKTTRVPLALVDAPWLAGRSILMLEPRRPAARMAAERMAATLGETVGTRVGHQVRFERRAGPRTRILVCTEGILTRRIQSDPELQGVGLLIFDELHERSLQADLGLALALDCAAALRPDLRILAMSATLDAEPVAALLGGATVIRAEGRGHPVDIRYLDRQPRDPIQAAAGAVREALAADGGDLLVFLPGAGEIAQLGAALSGRLPEGVESLPLHSSLPADAQQRALAPARPGRRRVVLATDLAETSVTIAGVTGVVDSGLARKPRFDPGSGLTRLVTEAIPLASADQRAGRAGRTGPGVCLRLWTRAQEVGRPAHRRPEILDADLAPLALDLALWGVRDPAALRWLDAPPPHHWAQAIAVLSALGALDGAGAVTPLGRRLGELPVHPRLGVMLLAGEARGAVALAADLAALLGERDPWRATPGQPRPADLGMRLAALESFREGRADRDMDRSGLAAIDRVARRLARGLDRPVAGPGQADPGALLCSAYPDRIAQARGGGDGRYLLAGGVGADLPADDPLRIHAYLVAADLDQRGRDARIRLALPIDEIALREACADRLQTEERVDWDPRLEAVVARRETRLGALVLDSRPLALAGGGRTIELLLAAVRRAPDTALGWDDRARQLRARVALVREHDPGGAWPDLSDAALMDSLEDWLGPWLDGKRALAEVRALPLAEVLGMALQWDQRNRLDTLAPESLTSPAGNRRRIDYLVGPSPVLALPIQELFGTRETPSLCNGAVPLTLHLLSPAGRPAQITRDLAGFWANGYAEVRKELRGRYPKHAWPEDPRNAAPVARPGRQRG